MFTLYYIIYFLDNYIHNNISRLEIYFINSNPQFFLTIFEENTIT